MRFKVEMREWQGKEKGETRDLGVGYQSVPERRSVCPRGVGVRVIIRVRREALTRRELLPTTTTTTDYYRVQQSTTHCLPLLGRALLFHYYYYFTADYCEP